MEPVQPRLKFYQLVITAVVIAFLAVLIPYGKSELNVVLTGGGALIVVWCVLIGAGITWYGRRGLWLLLTGPLLMFWPVGLWLVSLACRHNVNACP